MTLRPCPHDPDMPPELWRGNWTEGKPPAGASAATADAVRLDYMDLISRKVARAPQRGLRNIPDLHPDLFPHQTDTVAFCLEQGCAAPFLDTGLGKSFVELEFGRVVAEQSNKPVLLLTPLAVGPQLVREAQRFGIEARTVRSADDLGAGVNVTNYERLHLFRSDDLGGIVLDESSILKSFTGATTRRLMAFAEGLPDNCVDLSVYSPPFSSLYVYGESAADMGNVATDEEFFEQYRYLVREKLRVTRPGRLTAIHVKDLVYYQNSSEDGTAGLRAFSDGCTRLHVEEGWTFHCRITIHRDPVLERAKTNAHGLLWKTFQSDATFCRVGMPEYLLVYRKWAKPGEEGLVRPVTHPKDLVPLEEWQDLAGPVWRTDDLDVALPYGSPVWNLTEPGRGDGDLPATDVLNVDAARDPKAEKHICPMPLNITDRALRLWSNEGDTIFSPFMGIGSEGVAALRRGRRFVGTELNPTYWRAAVRNLQDPSKTATTRSLFDLMGQAPEAAE